MVPYAKFMNVNALFQASYTGKEDLGHKPSELMFRRDQIGSACYPLKTMRIRGGLVSHWCQP